MALTFSTATESDAAAIVALRQAVADDLTRRHGNGPWSWTKNERAVLHDLSRPRFVRLLIARDRSEMIATLLLQTKKPWAIDTAYFTSVSKPLYLVGMAVHPRCQGQGLGRLLLKQAEAHARDWPAPAIRLDAWDAPAGAGGFYARCGYREVGRVVYRTHPLIYFEFLL